MPTSFAGFTLTERLTVDAFGEIWAATGPGGRRARVRRVDPKLAASPSFAPALLAGGERLTTVEHANVVETIAAGRDDDGTLLVVTEHLEAPQVLERVLKDARLTGVRPSPALAVHVARALLRGLAGAHAAGIVHGGVHPRSVVVDMHGEVRLGDFAVARALAAAAAEDDSLLRGLLGYVAPELALGDAPDARSDVFAAGALLHDLLTGSPPPGLVEAPPAIVAVCERALAMDREARFADAGEMSAALDAAAASMPGPEPTARDVARFLSDARGAAEKSLDAQTEDLLADLVGDIERSGAEIVNAPPAREDGLGGLAREEAFDTVPRSDTEDRALGQFDQFGAEKTRSDDTPLPAPLPPPDRPSDRFRARVDDVLKPRSSREEELEPTSLREPNFAGSTDVRIDSHVGPLPQPPALRLSTEDVISTRPATPLPAPPPAPAPALAPPPATPSAPRPALAVSGTASTVAVALPAATPAPAPPPLSAAAVPDLAPRSRGLWIATGAVLVVAGAIIATQTDLLRPGAREQHAREAQKKAAEAQRAAEVARVRRADVVIDSEPPEAAVWMLLGTTPVDSLPLPTTSIYELRVEQQGFKSADVVVTPGRWSGDGEAMRAVVRVPLEVAPPGWEPPPAPTEPPPAEAATRSGQGQIHVDSDPPGAQVWLLVGFTPSVRVTNLVAEREYQFKLLLAGHAPGIAQVRAEDFLLPTGETRLEVVREVTLKPRPPSPAAPAPAPQK